MHQNDNPIYRDGMKQSITDKTISATEYKITKAYNKTYQKIINQLDGLYKELLEKVKNGEKVNRSLIYNLSTYNKLKKSMENEIKELGFKEEKTITDALFAQYEEIYKATIVELEIMDPDNSNIQDSFQNLSTDIIKTQIDKQWIPDGKNYSKRIWNNKSLLVDILNKDIVDNLAQGKSYQELVKTLRHNFDVTQYEARRLVITESAHIESIATADCYEDNGYTKGKIKPVSNACNKCKDKANKEYPLEEIKKMLPIHPNCRCVLQLADSEKKYSYKKYQKT